MAEKGVVRSMHISRLENAVHEKSVGEIDTKRGEDFSQSWSEIARRKQKIALDTD